MKYRRLAGTDLLVSEIGFGAWGIGGVTPGATSYGRTDDAVSRNAVAAAVEAGINFFDTSAAYGAGHSEELLGEMLAAVRSRVVIATKAGIERFGASPDFSPAALRRSIEGSLRRLRTHWIDVLQLHNAPPIMLATRPEIVAELDDMKRDGLVRAWGLSLKSPAEGLDALRLLPARILQVNLNLLDMRAIGSGLVEVAGQAGASLVARTPLCFGFLSGAVSRESVFPEGDHRTGWPSAQLNRWIDGAESMFTRLQVDDGNTRSRLALRFCLSFECVASAIPGMMTPGEVRENAPASDAGPLSEAELNAVSCQYRAIESELMASN